ncbi:hypothetical protein ABPG74_005166 [Tetrahymena malaccensis]
MGIKVIILTIALLSLSNCFFPTKTPVDLSHLPALTNMTFPEAMTYLNYPVETHYITTQDGYILTFFRIQAKNTSIKSGLPVVYFQHGLEDSSDTICLNDEENAPGLMIANAGYDLWLGNSRGNRYSLNHTKYSTSDKKFWQFTFQHMGEYDVPAAFDYISKATNQKINYIGHSQGTIQMFVALSRHEKNVLKNLKSYIALGPVAWVGQIKSPLLHSMGESKPLIDAIIATGIQQFLPYKQEEILPLLCSYVPKLCGLTLEALMDMNDSYDNLKRMNIFVGHLPAGTSTLNMRHWAQNIRSKEYRYFDYGKIENILHYGSTTAPKIQVEKINVPVHLFVGQTDELADVSDVEILRQNLVGSPNVTYNLYPFGHASFLIGKNMTYMNDVFAVLNDYNQKATKIEF